MGTDDVGPDQRDLYAAIASFRHQLRRFLAFSEAAAAEVGLPAQQHQALLAVAGWTGEGRASVGAVAEQLLIAPHTAAELIGRMVRTDLLTKSCSERDRRRAELALTPKALGILQRLTAAHLVEREALGPALTRALERAKTRAREDMSA